MDADDKGTGIIFQRGFSNWVYFHRGGTQRGCSIGQDFGCRIFFSKNTHESLYKLVIGGTWSFSGTWNGGTRIWNRELFQLVEKSCFPRAVLENCSHFLIRDHPIWMRATLPRGRLMGLWSHQIDIFPHLSALIIFPDSSDPIGPSVTTEYSSSPPLPSPVFTTLWSSLKAAGFPVGMDVKSPSLQPFTSIRTIAWGIDERGKALLWHVSRICPTSYISNSKYSQSWCLIFIVQSSTPTSFESFLGGLWEIQAHTHVSSQV